MVVVPLLGGWPLHGGKKRRTWRRRNNYLRKGELPCSLMRRRLRRKQHGAWRRCLTAHILCRHYIRLCSLQQARTAMRKDKDFFREGDVEIRRVGVGKARLNGPERRGNVCSEQPHPPWNTAFSFLHAADVADSAPPRPSSRGWRPTGCSCVPAVRKLPLRVEYDMTEKGRTGTDSGADGRGRREGGVLSARSPGDGTACSASVKQEGPRLSARPRDSGFHLFCNPT